VPDCDQLFCHCRLYGAVLWPVIGLDFRTGWRLGQFKSPRGSLVARRCLYMRKVEKYPSLFDRPPIVVSFFFCLA